MIHHHLEYGTESFAEALTYFPTSELFHVGADQYLAQIREAKDSSAKIISRRKVLSC